MITTMRTIEIPVREYTLLKKKAHAFETILYFVRMRPEFFEIPPVRSRKKIMSAFRETGKYSSDFLRSLQKGLQRSTFFSA
ncbi:MAG: hypothetical protein Q7S16_02065 [bacterium]|nr:hypothetical protein [bacterium]